MGKRSLSLKNILNALFFIHFLRQEKTESIYTYSAVSAALRRFWFDMNENIDIGNVNKCGYLLLKYNLSII